MPYKGGRGDDPADFLSVRCGWLKGCTGVVSEPKHAPCKTRRFQSRTGPPRCLRASAFRPFRSSYAPCETRPKENKQKLQELEVSTEGKCSILL